MRNVYMFSVNSPQASGTSREGFTQTGSGFARIDLVGPFFLTKIMFNLQALVSGSLNGRGFDLRFTDLSSGRRLFQVNDAGIDDGWLPANMFCGRGPFRQSNGLLDMHFASLPEECEIPAGGLIQVDLQYAPQPGVTGVSLGGTAYVSLLGYTYE